MRKRHLWLLAVAVTAALGLVATGSAAQEQRGRTTIIFGAEQEPAESLNGVLNCCNLAWASWTAGQTIQGAFQVQPNFSYKPNIISRARGQTRTRQRAP